MQILRLVIFSQLLSVVLSACGENHGTELPHNQNPPPHSIDVDRPVDGSLMQLSERSQWRAELIWITPPKFSAEEFLEMSGSIRFWNVEGEGAQSVDQLKFNADIPQYGQGTGKIRPIVQKVFGRNDQFRFNHLYFSKTGTWRIRILGEVNGVSDSWFLTTVVK